MPAQGKPRDMRLKIIACRQIYSGMSNGKRFTIFEIDAARLDGQVVREKLRAFEALPIGEEIDVTVQAFDSEKHGRSFTLHRKGSNNATERVNEIVPRVAALEETCRILVEKVETLERRIGDMTSAMTGARTHGPSTW